MAGSGWLPLRAKPCQLVQSACKRGCSRPVSEGAGSPVRQAREPQRAVGIRAGDGFKKHFFETDAETQGWRDTMTFVRSAPARICELRRWLGAAAFSRFKPSALLSCELRGAGSHRVSSRAACLCPRLRRTADAALSSRPCAAVLSKSSLSGAQDTDYRQVVLRSYPLPPEPSESTETDRD